MTSGSGSSAASASSAARSSALEMTGPAISCTHAMPSSAACRERGPLRVAAAGPEVTASSAARAHRVVGRPAQPARRRAKPARPAQPGDGGQQRRTRRERRVHVDPGEVHRAAVGRRDRARPRSAAGRSGQLRLVPAAAEDGPAAARRGRPPRPRSSASASDRRRRRSRPVSASPVDVACTWASTNAGATNAPSEIDDARPDVLGRAGLVADPADHRPASTSRSAVAAGSAPGCSTRAFRYRCGTREVCQRRARARRR